VATARDALHYHLKDPDNAFQKTSPGMITDTHWTPRPGFVPGPSRSTDAESVRNAATQLKDVAIDVLINSAGIAGASGQKTGNVNYESWAHEFNVNTMGPLRVVESFSDHIARSERRMVITITSGMGSLTDNTSGVWSTPDGSGPIWAAPRRRCRHRRA
jgi:NAD(P)-dependent dehydrogenase (short-subunit alcohol dehydrogenase family)